MNTRVAFACRVLCFVLVVGMMNFIIPTVTQAALKTTSETNTEPTRIQLKKLTMYVGDTLKIEPIITPIDAETTLIWGCSNQKVLSITSEGIVSAKKAGRSTITVVTSNGKRAKAIITVKNIKVRSIAIQSDYDEVLIGEPLQLTAVISPSDATNQKIQWKSSNPKVAKVDTAGVVVGKKAGRTAITATAQDGSKIKAKVLLVVIDTSEPDGYPDGPESPLPVPPTSITLNKKSLAMVVGETHAISSIVTPSNANREITWISSMPEIATIDSGIVRGISKGTSVITASTVNGLNAHCVVMVSDPIIAIEDIQLNRTSGNLFVGKTDQLVAQVIPANATDPQIYWNSSDWHVATVDPYGLVTARGPGVVKVFASTVNNRIVRSCVYTVGYGPLKATAQSSARRVTTGETVQFSIQPEGGSGEYTFHWDLYINSVLEVSDGSDNTHCRTVINVTSGKPGILQGKIRIASSDGQQIEIMTDEVVIAKPTDEIAQATGIRLEPREVTICKGETMDVKVNVMLTHSNLPWAGYVTAKMADQHIASVSEIKKISGGVWVISIMGKENGVTSLMASAVNVDQSSVDASAKVMITDDENAFIKGKLDELRGEFPEGSTWNEDYYGTQCNGFSRKIANRLFGTERGWASWQREELTETAFKKLRPGDCLQYYYKDDPVNLPTHTVVVYDTSNLRDHGYVTVLECNWTTWIEANQITWTRKIDFDHVMKHLPSNNTYRWIRKHP